MKKNKGFTIVELLLVVLIIGAITMFALPNIFDALKENKIRGYKEYERSLKESLELYNIDLEEDLWLNDENNNPVTEIELTPNDLKVRNKDLDIDNNNCVIRKDKGLWIDKDKDTYSYHACVYCEELEPDSADGFEYNNKKYSYRSDDCDKK